MYRRILSCILTVLLVLGQGDRLMAAETPAESELYAKSAVLIDGDSGRVLYEKNGHEPMANASTTKILTCILALELCEQDGVVQVSSYAASQPKVRLGMREGQSFYLRDLLYGLMLESFNDCAVAIAEFVAGDVRGFADLMNRKAAEIGCEDSYFITPNGLDGKDEKGIHHTTASDLALIMRYCIRTSEKAAEFLEITGTGQYSFADLEGKSSYSCVNHNAFLQMMEGALSGKTGFTGNAGYCYVGALEREGRTYIVALLACGWPNNKSYKWADTRKLMTYGIEGFTKKSVTEAALDEKQLAPISVVDGQGEGIGETAWTGLAVGEYHGCTEVLLAEGEQISVKYEIADSLHAPVKEGDFAGRISYMLGDEVLGECQISVAHTVAQIDFLWCLGKILELLWLW